MPSLESSTQLKRVVIIGAGLCLDPSLTSFMFNVVRMGWTCCSQNVGSYYLLLRVTMLISVRYLEIHPGIELTIIEAEKSIGGVWCTDRLYPGFLCDSPVCLPAPGIVGFFEAKTMLTTSVWTLRLFGLAHARCYRHQRLGGYTRL